MSEAIVEFRNVTKTFGDNVIFDGLDFTVKKNEIVTIIGSSGSGKSTLLRILMTLEKIDDGDVYVNGKNIWSREQNGATLPANEKHLREVRGECGMVFQHFNLFPHMTVLQNVTVAPIDVLKLSKKEAEERAVELLEMVGMGEKLDAYPSKLSGGQKQRVAIARALAMRPNVLLLDEITSALDPELVGEVLDTIKTLSKKHSLTMLIVTHEMAFARDVSHRICFFDKGRVLEEGAPEEFFQNPREARTQEFLKSYLRN